MVEAGRVDQKCGELLGRFGPFFARVEPFTQARKYIRHTWILRRIWGRATEPTLVTLRDAFPEAKVTFRAASAP